MIKLNDKTISSKQFPIIFSKKDNTYRVSLVREPSQ